ncbi:MAG: hypothetical protein JOZ80_15525 [Acidobacteriaceae bacterium]|nr:hypothetical protein [Acidobacteriaceae bacterium]
MAVVAQHSGRTPLAALQQFVRKPRESAEFCELCGVQLTANHSHLLELNKRRISCACEPCSILFVDNATQPYRRIPRDLRRLQNFLMDDHEWDSLLIPIKLAFFVDDSKAGRVVAQYPSPAGAMESSLDLEYWQTIVARNPSLNSFAPDVEALLVNRVSNPPQYFRAPIDLCYRLVGTIRKHWHGLSGGSEVWKKIDDFFGELNAASGGAHA